MIAQALAAGLVASYSDFMNAIASAGGSTVPGRMTLLDYLNREGYPRWRQKILFQNTAIKIARRQPGGSWEYVATQDSAGILERGDPVPKFPEDDAHFASDPQWDSYKSDLEGSAGVARDYVFVLEDVDEDVFVPDLFIERLGKLHLDRGAAVLDRTPEGTQLTLGDLARTVAQTPTIEGPPRKIIVVSHAYWQGILLFPTGPGLSEVTFESVDLVLPKLPMSAFYLEPRKPADRPPAIVFTGCQSGRAAPLIRKIRDAINPALAAYAPVYWFGVLGDRPRYMEYMSMPFEVYSTRALARDELIFELRKRDDRDPFGQKVPSNEWERLVPVDCPPDKFWNRREEVGTVLWHQILEETFTFPTSASEADFLANSQREFEKAVARVPLNSIHTFSPNHRFPMWHRWGFDSAANFLKKLQWDLVWDDAGGQPAITATGFAHHYTMLVPIGFPVSGRPWSGRTIVANEYVRGHPDPVTPGMPLSDTRFWTRIPPR